jgi:imidazolonepropionase-like amidohydrolase
MASSVTAAKAAPPSTVTLRYDVVLSDRIAGHATIVRRPDGSWDETNAYNDRGRGPDLRVHAELASDGIPTKIEVSGKDYLKRDVHELATCDSQGCKWDSDDEHGRGPRGYYIAINGAMGLNALLLKAARVSGKGVPMVPGGVYGARQLAEATLTHGKESRHVTAWEMSGFGFQPGVDWYSDDGELFATVHAWGGTIVAGFSDVLGKLRDLQKPLERAHNERVAREVMHRPEKGLAIVHARLFDPATLHVSDDVTIVVEGEKIKAVGAHLAPPAGAEVLDARGKTVLPGLWDMHSHLGAESGLLDLANGVTTARDLGNELQSSLERRTRWDANLEVGPHIILAGFIDGRGPYQGPTGLFVDTPEEARAAVERYAQNGYVQIKIYSSVKPELVPIIVREAHARGLRVSGHIPAHMNAEDAVQAGYNEIQHINFLMLDVLATRDEDTRTPLRFRRVAEKAADVNLDSPEMKQLIDLLVARHVTIDPTLSAFEDMFTARPNRASEVLGPVLARLPTLVRREAFGGGLPVPEGQDARFKESFRRCLQLVKRLYDRKLTLVAGTDNTAGFSLHRELELYAEAGIPNAEVLALATLGAAKVMGLAKERGSIAPGKDADVLIVDGDPLARMRDIRNVAGVVKGGVVVDVPRLLGELSIAPR